MKKADCFVKKCRRYNAPYAGSLARCDTGFSLLQWTEGGFLVHPSLAGLFDESDNVNARYRFCKLVKQLVSLNDYKFIALHPYASKI